MRKLLPQAFAESTVPTTTRPSPEAVPACQGCVGGTCQFRQIILQEVLRCKGRAADFVAARDDSWHALWKYGESHAKAANVPAAALPDATYCFLMNLAVVIRCDSAGIDILRKELQIMRVWHGAPITK